MWAQPETTPLEQGLFAPPQVVGTQKELIPGAAVAVTSNGSHRMREKASATDAGLKSGLTPDRKCFVTAYREKEDDV